MTNKQWLTWQPETTRTFQQEFIAWYEAHKRNLPWRVNTDPYRVWISEIMLQQTRVDTVIDYYYRFMEWFPTIEALAQAPEDKLLKAWEGLGYYSRARNLKVAANQIVTEYGGQMPQEIDEIRTLKGIGPYTAGAIASIAFNQPEPAIDGNVMRVVSRLFEIDADIAKASSRKIFDEAMRAILAPDRAGDFNQAMMDLGSAICTPTSPECENCPIQAFCTSYQKHTMLNFPVKSKKIKPKDVYYVAAAIENRNQEFLLTQRPAKGLLANMWHFPLQEVDAVTFKALQKEWIKAKEQQLTLDLAPEAQIAEVNEPTIFTQFENIVWQTRSLGEVTHVFSHLKWHILVFYGRKLGSEPLTMADTQAWAPTAAFHDYVFPKPQQKMVTLLEAAGHGVQLD